jgi:hypothetical protein
LSPTFAGIKPLDVPAFVLAQAIGLAVGMLLWRVFDERTPDPAAA